MLKKIGKWKDSTLTPQYIGKGYIHDNRENKGETRITFKLNVPRTGRYEVRLSYTPGSNRAKNIPVTIRHADGEANVKFDETPQPKIDNLFSAVGQWQFSADKEVVVTMSNARTTGYVIADAVQLVEVDEFGQLVVQQSEQETEQLKLAREAVADAKKSW